MRRTSTATILFLLLLLLLAPLHAQQWTAQRVLRIGEDEGTSFGRITGITANATELYVLDGMESRVYVFDAKGNKLRTFGKRGGGPGELSNLPTTPVLWSNQLVIPDLMNGRINLFATDGKFIDSRPLDPTTGLPMAWAALADRVVYLLQPMPMTLPGQPASSDWFTLHAIKGAWDSPAQKLADVARKPAHDMAMTGTTVKMKMDMRTPTPTVTTDGNTRILIATADTYRIRILNADGKLTGTLSRTVQRRKLSNAEITGLKKHMDSVMTAGFAKGAAPGAEVAGRKVSMPKPEVELMLPDYMPVIEGILAGERFVLVGRPATLSIGARLPSDWDVIGYDNRFLGTLRLPPGFSPWVLVQDRLIGIERDDLDVESVAVYRITPRK